MKKYLFGILAIAMAVGFSAFTTKNVHKPFSTITYYFTAAHKQVQPGQTNSLVQSEVKDVANWTVTSQAVGTGDYLSAITFDEDAFEKQEGINEVWNYYALQTPDDLPTDQGTFIVVKNSTNYTFTVRRKSTN